MSSPSNFNSIKVQLEQSSLTARPQVISFQFHKGTIRTLYSHRMQSHGFVFQFHKGTIRTT